MLSFFLVWHGIFFRFTFRQIIKILQLERSLNFVKPYMGKGEGGFFWGLYLLHFCFLLSTVTFYMCSTNSTCGGRGSDCYRKRCYLCRKEGTIKSFLLSHKLLPAGGYSEEVGHCKAAPHRLNMGGSPKFIWAPVYRCTHWLRPRNSPPPPAFGLHYEGAIGQQR